MCNIQETLISDGYRLIKRFEEYLKVLESELCHEMLPTQIQEIAVRGLVTITGLDLVGWYKFQSNLAVMLESVKSGFTETINDNIIECQENLSKLSNFLELIPDESMRFYDDIHNEINLICGQGDILIKEMMEWLQEFSDIAAGQMGSS